MGLFDKKEKSLKQEFTKKNVRLNKEAVKEIEELYDDLKSGYEGIEAVVAEFKKLSVELEQRLQDGDREKMQDLSKKVVKIDKLVRDAVRDVRDVLRNQKKRVKEAAGEI
ncbi:hypothetical protein HYN59_11970 [Flavobacterium album]|uniref:Uncharacterized protein n=1 Tax=Flavobacterium album TaxID=2175091 RepID=A0A2S1QZE8_9FLAO|nr:hypothetical protein [Flavobacterium album]AWH85782.1 hypothetical protein HYN59_11970 [Flavobacterium album]